MYSIDMATLERSLASRIVSGHSLPVTVVEGARAVGKTTLMRSQLERQHGYTYIDLSEDAVRLDAIQDLAGWLRRLPELVVIDEAQLVPALPVEVKRLVDSERRSIVLTGSASIGRNTLGGADALAGRAVRYQLHPLTLWEVGQHDGSIVDQLFEGTPNPRWKSSYTEGSLMNDLTLGGFPRYRAGEGLMTPRQRQDDVRAYIDGVIGSSVLPDRGRDALVATTILRELACTPGGILNASRIGSSTGLDRRTVDRYVEMFQQLFLVFPLRNLALMASKQSHARSKIHVYDTSTAVNLYTQAGKTLGSEREFLGALLETHVANQILPARDWSKVVTSSFYWRKTGGSTPEVDLVLRDSDDRLVGIEVKLSTTVSSADAKGLRALKADRGLHRGFVVYMGHDVRALDDDMWAIPVSALSTPDAWIETMNAGNPDSAASQQHEQTEPDATTQQIDRISLSANVDATLFVSYVHADNEHSRDRILQFMRDVQSTYHALYGYQVELFIDRDDILWGEQWQARLDRAVSETTFLVSFVTPRYLISEACRAEVLNFSAAARADGDAKLLLPLQWISTQESDIVGADDPVRKALEASQYIDISALRRTELGGVSWDDTVETVVERLRRTIEARISRRASSDHLNDQQQVQPVEVPPVTIVEAMIAVEEGQVALSAKVASFQRNLEKVTQVMGSYSPPPGNSPSAIAASFRALGQLVDSDVKALEISTSALGQEWTEFNGSIQVIIDAASGSPELAEALRDSLASVADMPEIVGLAEMQTMLQMFGALSADLRPMARAVTSALRLYTGIREAAQGWLEQVG